MTQCFKTRTGPAGRPGPGRPGPETGPGGGKNPLGNWPGETRSTRWVDPGPGPPGQTRVRPGQFFFILAVTKRQRFGLCHSISSLHHYQHNHQYISSLVVQA